MDQARRLKDVIEEAMVRRRDESLAAEIDLCRLRRERDLLEDLQGELAEEQTVPFRAI